MRLASSAAAFVTLAGVMLFAQSPIRNNTDPIKVLVAELELEQYKSTIKALTQFGDRRHGTARNRAALDWIEMQLKRYGCTDIERLRYEYAPAPIPPPTPTTPRATPVIASGEVVTGQGGSRYYGVATRTGANTDLSRQPDSRLRALNAEQLTPGPREEIYCTKIGASHPGEMYIVSAHMDGQGLGEAANDNASGVALVMELARILSDPRIRTERSIRFALWNSEESGLSGSTAYVKQRAALQGHEQPPGSGKYPEPKWLGMIQHDMLLWDHGMPRPDGSINPAQRPEADVNIEFQSTSKLSDEAMRLAFVLRAANEKYASDYPAAIGPHMTNTDSTPFMDLTPSISVRENERGMHIGAGWDPHWHQPTDVFTTFSDKDFRLGLNAAQTTLAAVAQLAGVAVQK
jgi:hypothetical protein